MKIATKDFVIAEGAEVDLKRRKTRTRPVYRSQEHYAQILADHVARLRDLQERHYAANRHALLFIFQAMDAAGKDGVIRHVMSGINPQGCQVSSFKHPSATELEHDFLWRTAAHLPERGQIGIFNRSYYEEVLVVKVHREILAAEGVPPTGEHGHVWRERYRSITGFERHSTPTARASSRSSSTSPRRSSASASSRGSSSRTRTGSSAMPTSPSGSTGRPIAGPTRTASRPPARPPRRGTWCLPTTRPMPGLSSRRSCARRWRRSIRSSPRCRPNGRRSSPPAAPACWPRATRGFPRRARPQWPRIARWAGSSAGRVPPAR